MVAVEQRQLQLQQEDDGIMAEARTVAAADDAIPATALTTARALGSSDFDAGFDEDRLIQAGASVYGGPSTVAQRVHELNGGLWGPNQEEEKEIALELSRLREEVSLNQVIVCVLNPYRFVLSTLKFAPTHIDGPLPHPEHCLSRFFLRIHTTCCL